VVDRQGARIRPSETRTSSSQALDYAEVIGEIRQSRWLRLKNNGFRTTGTGLMDGNGDVQLMGRMDDVLKVGGHSMSL
jgi:acyl-coenzyme A synthetase/AMP-(fatty) acid ligase